GSYLGPRAASAPRGQITLLTFLFDRLNTPCGIIASIRRLFLEYDYERPDAFSVPASTSTRLPGLALAAARQPFRRRPEHPSHPTKTQESPIMLKQPNIKYRSFPKVQLADRTWPDRVITQAPIWMSTDLRDGNQALFEPMNAERKMRLFKKLVDIGFKEIE